MFEQDDSFEEYEEFEREGTFFRTLIIFIGYKNTKILQVLRKINYWIGKPFWNFDYFICDVINTFQWVDSPLPPLSIDWEDMDEPEDSDNN